MSAWDAELTVYIKTSKSTLNKTYCRVVAKNLFKKLKKKSLWKPILMYILILINWIKPVNSELLTKIHAMSNAFKESETQIY